MSNHRELATDYFNRHKTSNECHVTSDGRVFHNKGTAESFSSTLEERKITTFTRAEVEITESLEPRIYTLEDFKGFDATTATYQDAKALVKELGLKPISQKQEDLVAVITAELEKIQA